MIHKSDRVRKARLPSSSSSWVESLSSWNVIVRCRAGSTNFKEGGGNLRLMSESDSCCFLSTAGAVGWVAERHLLAARYNQHPRVSDILGSHCTQLAYNLQGACSTQSDLSFVTNVHKSRNLVSAAEITTLAPPNYSNLLLHLLPLHLLLPLASRSQ